MRAITEREKRTIRFAVAGLAIYLVLFFGMRLWRSLEAQRAEYVRLKTEATRLKRDLLPYENRVLLAQKFKETSRLDPGRVSRKTVVAEASGAIQKAAASGKVQLGPMRESPGRSSGKELAAIQMEGTGQVSAVMTLLHQLPSLGFPLIVDAVQITPDNKPGVVKVSLTVVILDAEQWMKEPPPNA